MSEQHPQYQITQNYFGHYFIWNMLHNFGGTLGLFGSMDIINKVTLILILGLLFEASYKSYNFRKSSKHVMGKTQK